MSNGFLGLVGRTLGWEVGEVVLWDLVRTGMYLQKLSCLY